MARGDSRIVDVRPGINRIDMLATSARSKSALHVSRTLLIILGLLATLLSGGAFWANRRLVDNLMRPQALPPDFLLPFGAPSDRVMASLRPLSKEALSRNPKFRMQTLDHSQCQCAPAAENLIDAVFAPDDRFQVLDRQT